MSRFEALHVYAQFSNSFDPLLVFRRIVSEGEYFLVYLCCQCSYCSHALMLCALCLRVYVCLQHLLDDEFCMHVSWRSLHRF